VPSRIASPFAPAQPSALARRAAEALQQRLRRRDVAGGLDLGALDAPGGGKMFGVLVVAAPAGRVGYLCAFSGMLDGRWQVDGFAPPLFDPVARETFWPEGQATLRELADRHAELSEGAEPVALRARLAELAEHHQAAAAELRARHDANRGLRHDARQRLADGTLADDVRRAALHALAQESRADAAELRMLEVAQVQETEVVAQALRALDTRRAEVEHLRAEQSRRLWRQNADTYVLPNARGEQRTLAELFAPEPPPGGAGDCAAPKLLAHAYRQHLRPLALAEFWWGAPPLTGERSTGAYYPACQAKCGAVLPYMMEGLNVEPSPVAIAAPLTVDEPRLLYEDSWLLVVDKPCGLLSVPGRHAQQRDSVLGRIRLRFPDAASGPHVVRRLDAEASGLLLVARRPETHAALQRQFARREADECSVAWLDGPVTGDHGVIELPLRTDPDSPSRRCVDLKYGKRAITEWRVTQRSDTRTRVSFLARTDCIHQLRVHAAHPLGLGAPIVGDRVYGRGDSRLMLHVEALTFTQPHTGERLEFECRAPF
jgi:tRNA pseudouridine32 synthase/23S rRNA pseudouridine746 synthase